MGIYEHYEVGVWFESKEPLPYIQSMLPRGAYVVMTPDEKHLTMYFIKCFETTTSDHPEIYSPLQKQALRRLWQHLAQTQGFEPRRFCCITMESSTYSDTVVMIREHDFVLS